jgi:hypothetical protein
VNPPPVLARLRAAVGVALDYGRRLLTAARPPRHRHGAAEPEAGPAGSPALATEPAAGLAARSATAPAAGGASGLPAADAAPRTAAPPSPAPTATSAAAVTAAIEAGARPPAAAADAHPAPLPDPELDHLRGRAAKLEEQQLELTTRLADMEQRVREFEHRQYQALGGVLAECLRLRHEYLRLQAERSRAAADLAGAQAAREEFEAYRRAAEEVRDDPPPLAADERDELRRLYRAAAMRCHPDRVADAERTNAHDRFLRVQQAYRQRDLATLRLILAEIEAGPAPRPAIAAGVGLRQRVKALQIQVADLILAIQTLQLSASYRQVSRIEDWDAHFARAREAFEAECAALREQIAALA